MISFTLAITPVPKGRPIFGNGHARTPEKTRRYERDLATLARATYIGLPLTGPIGLRVDFYVERPKRAPKRVVHPAVRPDLDNFTKALKDAMNGILFVDDGQVCECFATKRYGRPRIEVQVWPLDSNVTNAAVPPLNEEGEKHV